MTNVIDIKLIIAEFDTHNDLILSVPIWKLNIMFDTYHLHYLFYDPIENNDKNFISVRRKVVTNYFNFWFSAFKQLKLNNSIIFPIGIHDQAINIFIFKLLDPNIINMSYGWVDSNILDSFDFLNIADYSIDYSFDINFQFIDESISYKNLIKDFEQIIKNFDTCQVKESQMKERNYPGITFKYPKEE